METHARYVSIGVFAAAVIAAAFVFVYWIQNRDGLSNSAVYRVRYTGPVPGLRAGGPVLFNGIRVGRVTALTLDSDHPGDVVATISVEQHVPVRPDTKAGIDRQGLLGEAALSLIGGSGSAAPAPAADGKPAELRADEAASEDLTAAARDTVQEIRKLVGDNADAVHTTFGNISQFSDALARNSGRVDTILAGLESLTGGGGSKSGAKIYDLTAPSGVTLSKVPTTQLVVNDPIVSAELDTQRVQPQGGGGQDQPDDGQWADSIPKLVQAKIVQTFENANYLKVGRPSDNLTADFQLILEIRDFRVSRVGEPKAIVSFSAKLVGAGGVITDARIFREEVPVAEPGTSGAASALDKAFGKVVGDLATWTSGIV
jgi:phospholipid/cholesterol/gamma-HCH transport system substrate-binding protein